MSYTIRMRDMGCVNTLKPAVKKLAKDDKSVHVLFDSGSIAAKELISEFTKLGIACFFTEDSYDLVSGRTFVTCLPCGAGYEFVAKHRDEIGKLVLVQEVPENPDGENRTSQWLVLKPDTTCVLTDSIAGEICEASYTHVVVTGLPSVDAAVQAVNQIDVVELSQRIGIGEESSPFVVSFPGDKNGCLEMLEVITPVVEETGGLTLVPTIHPKFKQDDPQGYDEFLILLEFLDCPQISVEADITFHEFSALGAYGHFVGPYNSSTLWQVNAAGGNVWVPALQADEEFQERICGAPFLEGQYGHMLTELGDFLNDVDSPCARVSSDGGSVERIMQEISE